MPDFRCITNNPMLLDKGFYSLEYYATDVLNLFLKIEKEVACGYRLLSHPLTGSIRPDITPYKSVILSGRPGTVDQESVRLIDRAISYTEDLYQLREIPLCRLWNEQAKMDFQLVDLFIIERALEVELMSL